VRLQAFRWQNCLLYLTLPYLRGGQAHRPTPAQRWGSISSA